MNPTASRLELLERCPSAGALSSVWTESTAAQSAGTARHRYLQRAREIDPATALADVPADAPWRAQCEALAAHLDEIPVGDHELAYAYDCANDTARFLGPWLDRAYDVSGTEVSGTADLVCAPTEERPRWLVVDFKGDEDVAPASNNLQLAFYALAVARVHGADEVEVAVAYLRHGGGIRWDRAVLDEFALEAAAARVRRVFSLVVAARGSLAPPDYATGYHCRRCPALTFCPAQTALLRAFLDDPMEPGEIARLSAEDAGAAYVRLKVLGEQVERATAAVRARAEVSGLPLPGGERLVPVEMPRRALVMDRALPVLREVFGEQADAAVERSLSSETINRLARQLAPGKGHRKAVDELWGKIEAAGGVRRSQYIQLRVKCAKGDAAAEGGEP